MSRFIHVAIIEDDEGAQHQFHAYDAADLSGQLAGWVHEHWLTDEWGNQPDDHETAIDDFFQKHTLPPSVNPGWECALWRAEPIEIDSAPVGPHSPGPWSQDPEGEVACTIEDANGKPIVDVYIERNAEGEITEESQANVDLVLKAPTMYGSFNTWPPPWLAHSAAGCTFRKGDKDPCPTCPKLITYLHICGLLQDELHEAHRTGHAEPGGED